jgi:hypothetical protein
MGNGSAEELRNKTKENTEQAETKREENERSTEKAIEIDRILKNLKEQSSIEELRKSIDDGEKNAYVHMHSVLDGLQKDFRETCARSLAETYTKAKEGEQNSEQIANGLRRLRGVMRAEGLIADAVQEDQETMQANSEQVRDFLTELAETNKSVLEYSENELRDLAQKYANQGRS